MRFYDILAEMATLQSTTPSSWPTYLTNLLKSTNIATGPKGERLQGQSLGAKSQTHVAALIKDFEAAEDKRAAGKRIEDAEVLLVPSNVVVPIKYIYKSPELKTEGKGKYWNDGEVAETLLGAALFARFISKDSITEEDVFAVIKSDFKPTAGGFVAKGERGNNPVLMTAINKEQNNKVVIEYVKKTKAFKKEFPSGSAGLDTALKACVAYVNESGKVLEAIGEADNNPESDSIQIKTDGITEQRGTKADLQLTVGKLKRLLSLKVNAVKQFGQESGSSSTVVATFLQRFIPGLDISSLVKEWPVMPAGRNAKSDLKLTGEYDKVVAKSYQLTGKAFKIAKTALDAQLRSDPESVVSNFYEGLVHHAQGSAEGQTLVILNPSAKVAWQELEFGAPLAEALKSFRMDATLHIAGEAGESNHMLRVYGRSADSVGAVAMSTSITSPDDAAKAKAVAERKKGQRTDPELLFQLRSYTQESGTQRNIVEMGPLLKDITDVQKINAASSADIVQAEPKQVVKPVKKTATVQKAELPQKPAPSQQPASPHIAPHKNVTTMKNNSWVSADDLENKFDNDEVTVEESPEDKDVVRLQKLAGIRQALSKGV